MSANGVTQGPQGLGVEAAGGKKDAERLPGWGHSQTRSQR